MSKSQEIAELACEVSRLSVAQTTAYCCGDHEYVNRNRSYIYGLRDQLQVLVDSASDTEIAEAEEITNAIVPNRSYYYGH